MTIKKAKSIPWRTIKNFFSSDMDLAKNII
jgi:hypothetical protein